MQSYKRNSLQVFPLSGIRKLVAKCTWPSEMLAAAESYAEKGTLNINAIKQFEKIAFQRFIILIAIGVFFLILQAWLLAGVVFALALISLRLDSRTDYRKLYAAYIFGERIDVRIVWRRIHIYGRYTLKCENIEGPKTEMFIELSVKPTQEEWAFLDVGTVLSVYQDRREKRRLMPDLASFKTKFSLNNSL